MRGLTLAILCIVCMASPVSAAPVSNEPGGSARSEFFTFAVENDFTIPAGGPLACPFPIEVHEIGWIRFHALNGPDGWLWERATWHIDYYLSANGVTVRDPFYRSTHLRAEAIVENSDGTITLTLEWSGIASHVPHLRVGDIGHVEYSVTFDPATGREVGFTVLRHAGQLTGDWSHGVVVLCDAFTT